MSHGSGGRAMAQLIDELFRKHLDNPLLAQGNDQALFSRRRAGSPSAPTAT
jgi:hydrogenase expression/formation protein HypE